MAERPRCRVCVECLEPPTTSVETICMSCGTKNRTTYSQSECVVEGIQVDPELELRERIEEFARLRNYTFSDSKERVIQALLKKRKKYGDFYCPCKARTVLESICPCKEARDGDVELNGKCSCRLFWKR